VSIALACAAGQRPPPRPEVVSMIQGPAGKLRVSDGGSGGGVPVLFVHGLGASWEVWRAALDHVRPERRAAALDLRGHGGSDAPATDAGYTIEALAEDVEAASRALTLPRFVLVGHSMAGAVLTAYASRFPEKVAGLVYVDAVGDFHKLPKEAVDKMLAEDAARTDLRPAYEELLGPKARPATREQVLASAARLPPSAFVALRRAMAAYDAPADARGYSGPAACIEAGDKPLPVLASALLPRARRRSLDGVSHWLMLDEPAAFARLLDDALSEMEKE
jgi:pimeloyl-ACP methyl ester carboxylesterase